MRFTRRLLRRNAVAYSLFVLAAHTAFSQEASTPGTLGMSSPTWIGRRPGRTPTPCNARSCNQSALRKRKREWLGPSRIDKLILGILLGLGKGKVQVTSHGKRNFCFGKALFIKFAFDDFAVVVSYIGRGGVAS